MPFAVGSARPARPARSAGLAALACLVLAACSGPLEPPANSAPRARIDTPGEAATLLSTDTLRLSGSATDDEDGELDGGALAWRSDEDGDLGTGPDLEAWGLALGDHWITLTATDSDGDTGTDSVRVTVEDAPSAADPPPDSAGEPPPDSAADQPPAVTLTAPADRTARDEGTSIALEGSATDPEDGPLTGASLVWSSDVDGELGTGETLGVSTLTPGPHVLTLTATDSDGNSAAASVDLLVEAPGYDIRLVFLGEFEPGRREALEASVGRWEAAITEDLPHFFPSAEDAAACGLAEEGIDDLVVTVEVGVLGDAGGATASAAPCLLREDDSGRPAKPIAGRVVFNRDFLDRLSDDALAGLLVHEVGHVLGIGSPEVHAWSSNVQGPLEDRFFDGETTLEAFYVAYFGEAYIGAPVPLETDGAHWRWRNFGFEIMSALRDGFTPMSRVTIGALADLGYAVDMSAADPYTLPMPQVTVFRADADATLSEPTQADENFGVPEGTLLSETLVAGANHGLWSDAPDDERFTALLRIPVFARAPEVVITRADLFLEVRDRDVTTPGQDLELWRVTEAWSEAGVTWDTRPALGDEPLDTVDHDSCTTCQFASASLFQLAEDWSDGAPNHGLALVAPGAAADPSFSVGFWTRHAEEVRLRPRLEITAHHEEAMAHLRADEGVEEPDASVVIPLGDDILEGPVYIVDPSGAVRRIDGGR